MRSLIHVLPTFQALLPTPQSAAVIARCVSLAGSGKAHAHTALNAPAVYQTMVKPSYRTDSLCLDQKGYQQALDDFGIAYLLTRLKTYSDDDFDAAWMNLTQSELESLAAILIRDLTANLNGKAIAGYLQRIAFLVRYTNSCVRAPLRVPLHKQSDFAFPHAAASRCKCHPSRQRRHAISPNIPISINRTTSQLPRCSDTSLLVRRQTALDS